MYTAFSFVLASGLISCKSTSQVATSTASDNSSQTTDRPSNEELEKLFYAKKESDLKKFNQADVDFMTGMIAHHAQALIMSDLAAKNGAAPSVQVLASRIINAQKDEIALMQKWLRDREQPVPEVHIEGLMLMIHGLGDHQHMDHTNMRGMLSQVELNALGEAQGTQFDQLFLTGMINHHSGAVFMVENLFATDGTMQDDAIFKIASDIQVDQRTEIARMRLMLKEMFLDSK